MSFWSSFAEAFSGDGAVTTFMEKIPVVGYGVAGAQALAGNGEHAKRALATSTNSLITTAGAVGGMLVGGPAGALVGGAAAAHLGMFAEYGISTTIKDESVKGDVGEVSWKRAEIDAVLGGISGAIGGGVGASRAGKAAGKAAIDQMARLMASISLQQAASIIYNNAGKQAAKAVTTAYIGAFSQGISKGVFGSKKKRVCTEAQETRARQMTEMCEQFISDYPLLGIIDDAYRQVHGGFETIVENMDWVPANDIVQHQLGMLRQKISGFSGLSGLPPLQKRARDALQRIGGQDMATVIGNAKKIRDMMGEEGDFQLVMNRIEMRFQNIQSDLENFSTLMATDGKWVTAV